MTDYVVNELLCVLKNNFSKYPRTEIMSVMADFYSENEVETAKSTLCNIAENCVPKPDTELKKIVPRKGDGKIRRDIDDIFNIYTVLDSKKCALPMFVAMDTTRVPTFRDIELNKINMNFDSKVNELKTTFNDRLSQLSSDFQSSVSAKITELQSNMSTQVSDVKTSMTKQLSDLTNSVKLQFDEIKLSLTSQSSVLDTTKNSTTSQIEEFRSQLTSQMTEVNNSISTQISDVLSTLSTQSSQIDDVKNSSSHQLTQSNDTVLAHMDEIKQSLDSQSSNIEDVKTTVTALLPDTGTLYATNFPVLASNNSVNQSCSGPVNNSADDKTPWLTVTRGKSSIQMSSNTDRQPTVPPSGVASVNNRRRVVGCCKSTATTFTSSSLGKWHVFVGRLDKDTSGNDIKDYLEKNDISVLDIKKLEARQTWQEKSSAFRICVHLRCKDAIMNPELWPDNVEVRDWFFKPK